MDANEKSPMGSDGQVATHAAPLTVEIVGQPHRFRPIDWDTFAEMQTRIRASYIETYLLAAIPARVPEAERRRYVLSLQFDPLWKLMGVASNGDGKAQEKARQAAEVRAVNDWGATPAGINFILCWALTPFWKGEQLNERALPFPAEQRRAAFDYVMTASGFGANTDPTKAKRKRRAKRTTGDDKRSGDDKKATTTPTSSAP